MKKFLLACVVMAVAASVQAVTLSWKTTTDNGWITNAMDCALVYSTADDATIDKAVDVAFGITHSAYASVETVDWSRITLTEGSVSTVDTYTQVTNTGTYFIIFTEGDKYAATSVAATDASGAWTSVAGGSTVGTPVQVDSFTGTLVPEPTALALLALGVAGLALRRRA